MKRIERLEKVVLGLADSMKHGGIEPETLKLLEEIKDEIK